MTERGRATALGIVAILLWAGLALCTVAAAGIPPFQLLALSFGVAFLAGMVVLLARGRAAIGRLRQPPAAWCLAFAAIFLYHALYYLALSEVPPERASLIAYLWPLMIVLLSGLGSGGHRLRARHLAGAMLGFLGAAVILPGGAPEASPAGHPLGYLAAFGCALVWSGYSVLNRRFAQISSEMLIGVCGAVALAGALAHLALEDSVRPDSAEWLAILLLGLGPTGLAFLAWDHATKHGNMPLLGALSYLAPLLSTLLLVVTGQVPGNPLLAVSALLIGAGAALASSGPGRTPHHLGR